MQSLTFLSYGHFIRLNLSKTIRLLYGLLLTLDIISFSKVFMTTQLRVWCLRLELNQRPSGYESDALAN